MKSSLKPISDNGDTIVQYHNGMQGGSFTERYTLAMDLVKMIPEKKVTREGIMEYEHCFITKLNIRNGHCHDCYLKNFCSK